jgi:hypothetical protein
MTIQPGLSFSCDVFLSLQRHFEIGGGRLLSFLDEAMAASLPLKGEGQGGGPSFYLRAILRSPPALLPKPSKATSPFSRGGSIGSVL